MSERESEREGSEREKARESRRNQLEDGAALVADEELGASFTGLGEDRICGSDSL